MAENDVRRVGMLGLCSALLLAMVAAVRYFYLYGRYRESSKKMPRRWGTLFFCIAFSQVLDVPLYVSMISARKLVVSTYCVHKFSVPVIYVALWLATREWCTAVYGPGERPWVFQDKCMAGVVIIGALTSVADAAMIATEDDLNLFYERWYFIALFWLQIAAAAMVTSMALSVGCILRSKVAAAVNYDPNSPLMAALNRINVAMALALLSLVSTLTMATVDFSTQDKVALGKGELPMVLFWILSVWAPTWCFCGCLMYLCRGPRSTNSPVTLYANLRELLHSSATAPRETHTRGSDRTLSYSITEHLMPAYAQQADDLHVNFLAGSAEGEAAAAAVTATSTAAATGRHGATGHVLSNGAHTYTSDYMCGQASEAELTDGSTASYSYLADSGDHVGILDRSGHEADTEAGNRLRMGRGRTTHGGMLPTHTEARAPPTAADSPSNVVVVTTPMHNNNTIAGMARPAASGRQHSVGLAGGGLVRPRESYAARTRAAGDSIDDFKDPEHTPSTDDSSYATTARVHSRTSPVPAPATIQPSGGVHTSTAPSVAAGAVLGIGGGGSEHGDGGGSDGRSTHDARLSGEVNESIGSRLLQSDGSLWSSDGRFTRGTMSWQRYTQSIVGTEDREDGVAGSESESSGVISAGSGPGRATGSSSMSSARLSGSVMDMQVRLDHYDSAGAGPTIPERDVSSDGSDETGDR